MTEKPMITDKLLKVFYERLPSVKGWYEDGSTGQTLQIISPWNLPEEAIEKAINIEFNMTKTGQMKYTNFEGLPEYYLTFNIRLLENYDHHYTFERLKKILLRYCELSEEVNRNNRVFKCLNSDDAYDFNDEKGVKNLVELLLKKASKDELSEVEGIIDKYIDVFLYYTTANWRWDVQRAPKYINEYLQNLFPFSEEFIYKHKDDLLISEIIQNPILIGNIDLQKFLFSEVLKSNLEAALKFFTNDTLKHDFTIDEDLCDAMVLKYNL